MTKSNGYAYCDRCGRSVSYKTSGQASGTDAVGGGCLVGCLSGCLAIVLKYVLIGGAILVGIVVLAIIVYMLIAIFTW